MDGLLGRKRGVVAHLSNIANKSQKIEGDCITGGIVGLGGQYSTLIINNSYNQSEIISRRREAGGIIGDNDAITYCINVFNVGDCTAQGSSDNSISGTVGGLIGSGHIKGVEIFISNAYNVGTMNSANASGGYSCGIMGVVRPQVNESHIKNVYNKGNLINETNNKYGIIGLGTIEGSELDLQNAFYVDNVDKGTNYTPDNSISKTKSQINSQEFVDVLNKYVTENPVFTIDGYKINLSKWKLGDKGYPVMEE